MMQYVRLENGVLKRCPRYGMSGRRMHTDLPRYYANHPDIAYADGWLQMVTADKPDGAYTPSYTVDGDKVVQSWTPIEQEAVPTIEDDVSQLKTDVAELTDAVLDMSKEVYKEDV